MRTFKGFLKEEVDQYSFQTGGDLDIMDSNTMMNINTHLARVSNDTYVTPHVGLEKVRQTLAYFNIALPRFNFHNPEEGETAFEVMPFGGITGKDLSGNDVKEPSVTAYVYFAWERTNAGTFMVDAEIMSEADLEDLLGTDDDDADDYADDHDYNMSHGVEEAVKDPSDHTKNPYHKILTSHGYKHSGTVLKGGIGGRHQYHQHTYDAGHNKTDKVHVWSYADGTKPVWHSRHKQQSNDIMAPGHGDTKPQLDKKLKRERARHDQKSDYVKESDSINEISSNKAFQARNSAISKGWEAHDKGDGKTAKKRLGQSIKFDKYMDTKGRKEYSDRMSKFDKEFTKGIKEARFKPLSAQNDETRARITSKISKDDEEGANHIIMQLRKVISLRGEKPVKFKDGKSVKIDPDTATRFIKKYNNLTKPMDKEKLQTIAGASYDAFKKVVSEDFQIDELSKKTLGSYVKKASHDVATKSAATARYAERSQAADKKRKETGDYSGYRQARKDDETSNKMFDKSWKRRKGIAKAVDKLTETDQIDELSKDTLKSYIKKGDASYDRMLSKSVGNTRDLGRGDKMSKDQLKSFTKLRKKTDKRAEYLNKAEKKVNEESDKDEMKRLAANHKSINDTVKKDRKSSFFKARAKNAADAKAWNKKYSKVQEDEQIDELSKKTLGSYVKKAADDRHNQGWKASRLPWNVGKDADKALYKGDHDKIGKKISDSIIKRRKGIERATDKLMKENALNELSKNKMFQYGVKAADSVGDLEAKHGRSDMRYKGEKLSDTKGKAKAQKRLKYMGKAFDKVYAKEDEQIDELSTGKLNDYLRKNTQQTAELRRKARPQSGGGDHQSTLKANHRDQQFKKIAGVVRKRARDEFAAKRSKKD